MTFPGGDWGLGRITYGIAVSYEETADEIAEVTGAHS